MSHLLNARLAKYMKIIFSVLKNVSTNNNKRAIEFPNSKQNVLTSIRYIRSNYANVTKSTIFGFSLFGLIGLDKNEKNRELIDTIEKGLLYLQVSNR